MADDVISKLGFEQEAAKNYNKCNIISRFSDKPMENGLEYDFARGVYAQLKSFRLPTAKLLLAIVAGDKALAAKEY